MVNLLRLAVKNLGIIFWISFSCMESFDRDGSYAEKSSFQCLCPACIFLASVISFHFQAVFLCFSCSIISFTGYFCPFSMYTFTRLLRFAFQTLKSRSIILKFVDLQSNYHNYCIFQFYSNGFILLLTMPAVKIGFLMRIS